jgi:hypothetical protein
MKKRLNRFLCCCIFSMGICQSSLAEIYKRIDDQGRVHFSDIRSDDLQQEKINLRKNHSDWKKYEIKIQVSNVSLTSIEMENITNDVNYVYEFFDNVLYFDMYKTVPVNILILEHRDAYVKYLSSIDRENLASSYGVFLGKENQIIVYIREDRAETFKTIRHEVSHAIVDTIIPYAPAWLNEGLAEQMETLARNESGLYIKPHVINRESVDWSLKNGTLIEISEFLKLPSSEWKHSLADEGKQVQSHAGQFLYFLLSTPPNRSFVTKLMHNFSRGDRTISYYLVDDNYIGGVKSLKIAWSSWVNNQSGGVIKLF